MKQPKTKKQCDIRIKSLKKQLKNTEVLKKKLNTKKPTKKKPAKKKAAKKRKR